MLEKVKLLDAIILLALSGGSGGYLRPPLVSRNSTGNMMGAARDALVSHYDPAAVLPVWLKAVGYIICAEPAPCGFFTAGIWSLMSLFRSRFQKNTSSGKLCGPMVFIFLMTPLTISVLECMCC